ncbi:MAG: ABC transporter permease, partial [Firmicutes bacterium]|nr:ABC transporter permease [Bacillota bacterium]
MGRYVVRRTLASLGFIFLLATLVFLLVHVLPGDPVKLLLGETGAADEATLAALRSQLGLDVPLLEQYRRWMVGIVTGDLGESLFQGESVRALLAYHFPRSLELIVTALLVSAVVGVGGGGG